MTKLYRVSRELDIGAIERTVKKLGNIEDMLQDVVYELERQKPAGLHGTSLAVWYYNDTIINLVKEAAEHLIEVQDRILNLSDRVEE